MIKPTTVALAVALSAKQADSTTNVHDTDAATAVIVIIVWTILFIAFICYLERKDY